ncbi:MAG: hypothetical protein CM1200mP2_13930 [Planctomycetaceae bacterium]|nr:MAG: hypothetical protein CM1200mP2_13930 [Planctomycetaceae bacterium]
MKPISGYSAPKEPCRTSNTCTCGQCGNWFPDGKGPGTGEPNCRDHAAALSLKDEHEPVGGLAKTPLPPGFSISRDTPIRQRLIFPPAGSGRSRTSGPPDCLSPRRSAVLIAAHERVGTKRLDRRPVQPVARATGPLGVLSLAVRQLAPAGGDPVSVVITLTALTLSTAVIVGWWDSPAAALLATVTAGLIFQDSDLSPRLWPLVAMLLCTPGLHRHRSVLEWLAAESIPTGIGNCRCGCTLPVGSCSGGHRAGRLRHRPR